MPPAADRGARTGRWHRCRAALTALLLVLAVVPAAAGADPRKVLRVELRDAEASLDPALAADVDGLALVSALYEPPLVYDYLARPVRLQPGLLARMPQSADGGLHWRLELRAGLRFAPDPVFGRAGTRAITATDLADSLRRLADPALHSPYAWLVRDHVVAIDVRGPLVLELALKHAEADFPAWLSLPATAVVPREAVQAPGGLDAHPVGSGPYRLASRVRGARYVLEANPAYRARQWDFASDDPALATLVAGMRGRPVPAIGRIEVAVIEEPHSAWLSFRRGALDLLWLQDLMAPAALADLPPGGRLDRIANPDMNYFMFNLRDPDFGGMTPARIALRRAVLMAIDTRAWIREVRSGQAEALDWPVPPGLPDDFPAYRGVLGYDVALARALLDAAGFPAGPGGQRRRPDGRPLVLRFDSRPGAQARTQEEFLHRALQAIGVGLEVVHRPYAEFMKAAHACQLSFAQADWNADGPDGQEFFARLSPARVGAGSHLCPSDAGWQQDYEAAAAQASPESRRQAWLRLAREAEYAGAWKPAFSSYRNVLVQGRVLGYHSHPLLWSVWQYLDLQ